MTVNWNEPIEAVHEDGRVHPVKFEGTSGPHWIAQGDDDPRDIGLYYNADGTSAYSFSKWRIRNVQPAAAKPAGIDAALVDRMVEALKEVAAAKWLENHTPSYVLEARAIVAELPEQVDTDLLEARKVAVPYVDALTNDILDGGYDSSSEVCAALAGIKLGRQLEREAK